MAISTAIFASVLVSANPTGTPVSALTWRRISRPVSASVCQLNIGIFTKTSSIEYLKPNSCVTSPIHLKIGKKSFNAAAPAIRSGSPYCSVVCD
jgi:hypothetical protein